MLYKYFTGSNESNQLFHASPTKGLTILKPHTSTHGTKWVYAAKQKHIAALFIGNWYDQDLMVGGSGTYWSPLTITEQYEGAFEKAFKGKSGSIYTINDDGFSSQTGWGAEVVSPSETDVIQEEVIDDVEVYLQNLISLGHIKLHKYVEPKQAFACSIM